VRRAWFRALVAALAAAASWPVSANQAGRVGDPEYFVEGLRCLEGKHSLRLPNTLPALTQLAPVLKIEDLGAERWEGYTTTRRRIRFAGLTVGVVAYSNDSNRYSLETVEIRGGQWSRIAPFAVGETIESVRGKLGEIAVDDETLRSTYSGENESLRFETKSGRVSAVIYQCYTG
jgi:hypothetical protein